MTIRKSVNSPAVYKLFFIQLSPQTSVSTYLMISVAYRRLQVATPKYDHTIHTFENTTTYMKTISI